jgi:hypothetical protein
MPALTISHKPRTRDAARVEKLKTGEWGVARRFLTSTLNTQADEDSNEQGV